ncbi:MAG: prepilin-type N-terminal cleavage/methylation domain-containing protein [Chthoniobacterales bacterium]
MKATSGFTLLEILVAAVVFSVLVLLLAQIIAMTGLTIGISQKKLDSAGQARMVFSRLAADFAARPRRSDLGMTFEKETGNDSFRFYSGVAGHGAGASPRNISLVEYRVQESTPGRTFQLERGATATGWDTGSPQPNFNTYTLPSPNTADYDVFDTGIFRLEFVYILNTDSPSSRISNTAAADYSDVASVIVTIAVLDEKSRSLLTDAQVGQLAAKFTDAADGQEPIVEWSKQLSKPDDFPADIPRSVVQGIHLYQGVFHVR